MINNERIVPIQKIDRLSAIGEILTLALPTSYRAIKAIDTTGVFSVLPITGSNAGSLLANQPVKTLDFADGVTAATVYFIPAYDYAGMTIAGVATTPTGDVIQPDGVTLYRAELDSGVITITAITPSVPTE